MRLPRFLGNIVRAGASPEIVTTRNFDELGNVLEPMAQAIEGHDRDIYNLGKKISLTSHLLSILRGQVFNVFDYGAKGDGVTDDADAVMRAIAAAQLVGGAVFIPYDIYIGKPIEFSKTASGEYRFSVYGSSQRRSFVHILGSVSTGSPIAAMFQFDNSGGNFEDLEFRNLSLNGNSGRANYGIDISDNYAPTAVFDRIRINGTRVAGIAAASWNVYLDNVIIRNCTDGDCVYLVGGTNNAVNLIETELVDTPGFGLRIEGGFNVNMYGGTIEDCQEGGIMIEGPLRSCLIDGTYFEGNGGVGTSLSAGSPVTIKSDVVVNGGSAVNMSNAFPTCNFTCRNSTHANGDYPAEYAFYLIGGMDVVLDNCYRGTSAIGINQKLVGVYPNPTYSRPENVTVRNCRGFTADCVLPYSSLSGGTFTVGEYVAVGSGTSPTACGKIRAIVSSTLYIEATDDKDLFTYGAVLKPATRSGSVITISATVTANCDGVSYSNHPFWNDAAFAAQYVQKFGTFASDRITKKNYVNVVPSSWTWSLNRTVSDLTFDYTGSNAGTDEIALVVTSGMVTGDKFFLRIDGGSAGGLTSSAYYYYITGSDSTHFKVATTRALALLGTNIDITADIGAGDVECQNGEITEDAGLFRENPIYSIRYKLETSQVSGRVAFGIDLDTDEFSMLRGKLVYFGAWVKCSHVQMAQVLETTTSGKSVNTGNYTDNTRWTWREFQTVMPFSGIEYFYISFTAGLTSTAWALALSNPIISEVGVPHYHYSEPVAIKYTGTGGFVKAISPTLTGMAVTDLISSNGLQLVTGGTEAAGKIAAIATDGMTLSGISGSTMEFSIHNKSAQRMISIPNGTQNLEIGRSAGSVGLFGPVTANGVLKSSGATGGVGYATGAGGAVTQNTDKSTGVTLSKVTGQITMNNAALAAGVSVSFTLTNTAIAATDVLSMNSIAGTLGAYSFDARCSAGSALISVRNLTAGSLSEAVVIGFVLIKGVTA